MSRRKRDRAHEVRDTRNMRTLGQISCDCFIVCRSCLAFKWNHGEKERRTDEKKLHLAAAAAAAITHDTANLHQHILWLNSSNWIRHPSIYTLTIHQNQKSHAHSPDYDVLLYTISSKVFSLVCWFYVLFLLRSHVCACVFVQSGGACCEHTKHTHTHTQTNCSLCYASSLFNA